MDLPNTVFENIWLADDDIDDCEIFEDAIKQILPSSHVTFVHNGEDLMKLLENSKPPDILFLDINMPCKDGLDCLKEIRASEQLFKLPIVVFSSSPQPKHIENSYEYGANLYYQKPTKFSNLIAGLSDLFKMNWKDPYTITSEHYINNQYIPYSPPALNL